MQFFGGQLVWVGNHKVDPGRERGEGKKLGVGRKRGSQAERGAGATRGLDWLGRGPSGPGMLWPPAQDGEGYLPQYALGEQEAWRQSSIEYKISAGIRDHLSRSFL